jgi:hypothetical protein
VWTIGIARFPAIERERVWVSEWKWGEARQARGFRIAGRRASMPAYDDAGLRPAELCPRPSMRQGHGGLGRGAFRNDNCEPGWHVGGMKAETIIVIVFLLIFVPLLAFRRK